MNNPYDQNETCDGCGYDASDCRCALWHADICGTPWAQRETPVFQVLADSAATARTLIARANNVDELRVQVLRQEPLGMGYHRAMRINHPAFDFGHAGITFEVSPDESVWFSVERFVEESEYITLETRERDSDTMYATYRKTDMIPYTSIVTGV